MGTQTAQMHNEGLTKQSMTPSSNSIDKYDGLIACHDCDLLVKAPLQTSEREHYRCPRCHHLLYSGEHHSDHHLAAVSLTALIIFIIANSFDFLTFVAQGQEVSISLAASAFVLWDRDFILLGVLVLAFILVLPALYLICLIALLVPVEWSSNSRLAIGLGRLMSALLPWAMAEVFLIGVLVALIKIVSIATIVFGTAFWAYVLFTALFMHLAVKVDRLRLWRLVDQRRGLHKKRFKWSDHANA